MAQREYRRIKTEEEAYVAGLRVDSSTGKLYALKMNDELENLIKYCSDGSK